MLLPVGTIIQNKYSRMRIEKWLDSDNEDTDEQDELVEYLCICIEATEHSSLSVGDKFTMSLERLTAALTTGARRVITMGEYTTQNPNKLGNFPRKTAGEE